MPNSITTGIGIDFGTTKSYIVAVSLDDGRQIAQAGPIATMVRPQVRLGDDASRKIKYLVDINAAKPPGTGDVIKDIKKGLREEINFNSDGVEFGSEILASVVIRTLYMRLLRKHRLLHPQNDFTTITIPANIGMNSRASTLFAAKLADFTGENVALIEEPLAAFLGFYHDFVQRSVAAEQELAGKKILIFDFGGGTCDVASIQMGTSGQPPIVLNKESDNHFGGDFITEMITQSVLGEKYERTIGYERNIESRRVDRWKESVTENFWRNNLNFEQFLQLDPPRRRETMLEAIDSYGVPLLEFAYLVKKSDSKKTETAGEFRVSSSQFDEIVETAIKSRIRNILNNFRKDVPDYERILLVGGSSRLPQVAMIIHDWLAENGLRNPHEKIELADDERSFTSYIARGAALYNYYHLKGMTPIVPLMDRSLSYVRDLPAYLRAEGNIEAVKQSDGIDLLIPANTYLPYPSENSQKGEGVPEEFVLTPTRLPNGQIAFVLRTAYDIKSGPQEHRLIYFETDERNKSHRELANRLIDLPQSSNPFVRLEVDLRVNEWGLLDIFVKDSTAPNEKREIKVDFRNNPYNLRAINRLRVDYNVTNIDD